MEQATVDIIHNLLGQYDAGTDVLRSASQVIAKEIFYATGLMSMAILGFNLLLKRNQDLTDTHIELIKWLVYLIFLYAFINNFGDIADTVFGWIDGLNSYFGIQVVQPGLYDQHIAVKPENVFAIGITIAKKMLNLNVKLNFFRILLPALVSVVCAAVVLFCFAVIGLELILVQVGSKLILAGGVFLLAFAALPWTREYAERYVHTFFHIGIKMVFVNILIAMGINLSKNWTTILAGTSDQQWIEHYLSVALASYVYYKLCAKVPDQAVSWLTGRFPLSFETGTDMKAAMKVPAIVAGKAIETVHGLAGYGRAAMASMQSTKMELEAQGQKAKVWNTATQSIKTFGAALKEETWGKKVDETTGGKMAKSIMEQMAKADKKSDGKKDSDDIGDFSI